MIPRWKANILDALAKQLAYWLGIPNVATVFVVYSQDRSIKHTSQTSRLSVKQIYWNEENLVRVSDAMLTQLRQEVA